MYKYMRCTFISAQLEGKKPVELRRGRVGVISSQGEEEEDEEGKCLRKEALQKAKAG